jgi:hypothetical protein
MSEGVMQVAADEAIFLPFFLMESLPEGEARIYLLLWDRMVYTEWVEGGEKVVRRVLREEAPQDQLAYMLVKNVGDGWYEYEAGMVSADEGLVPYVLARIYLAYTKGEAMA